MPPVFVDTSGVIALLNLDDEHHASAEAWFRYIRRRRWPLLTTTAILTEVGDGFAQKGRWDLAEPFLLAVYEDRTVEIVSANAELVLRAIEFRRGRPDKRWSLTRCVSFLAMTDRNVRQALTADQDFQQAGFRTLLRELVPAR